ncbi:hypothetical protein ACLOJK_018381 [Asimina triloba]
MSDRGITFRVQADDDTGGEPGAAPEGEHGCDEVARESDAASNVLSQKPGIDLFNNEEGDPAKSNAMSRSDVSAIFIKNNDDAKQLQLSTQIGKHYAVLFAAGSSLWEIDTLRHHYCPAVSRFVASLENDLTVRAKTSEITIKDFSYGSYATIFRDEPLGRINTPSEGRCPRWPTFPMVPYSSDTGPMIRRRVKQVPLGFYQATPTALFSESDFPGWTFGFGSVEEELGAKKTGEPDACQEDNTLAKRQKIEHS